MKVRSLMKIGMTLEPVDVEVHLVPGLPQISIIGLPDAALKESALRIKSAIRAQGFQFPRARRVLVDLKPNHLKKSSRGIELAIAAAILWETKELNPATWLSESSLIYGELSLTGEVFAPDDLECFRSSDCENPLLITGSGGSRFALSVGELRSLVDLRAPVMQAPGRPKALFQRPPLPFLKFSQEQARLLSAIAAGEHSTLLAGTPGAGKSTIVSSAALLLEDPEERKFQQSRQINNYFGTDLSWRPIVRPHHNISTLAMIGGGTQPKPGEITRAHGGALILDEFLEFDRKIQESLREPTEDGYINITRNGKSQLFPAEFLLLGTTNLCVCGQFLPDTPKHECRCSLKRRSDFISRINGPMLDRFAILEYLPIEKSTRGSDGVVVEIEKKSERELSEIQNGVFKAIEFRKETRCQQVNNSRLKEDELLPDLNFSVKSLSEGFVFSRRRELATLQVSRTLADLEQSHKIERRHFIQAQRWTQVNFLRLTLH